jgi:hypothetical protein
MSTKIISKRFILTIDSKRFTFITATGMPRARTGAALADMYEKAAELRGMFAYLAKEHGIRLPYPPVRDRA